VYAEEIIIEWSKTTALPRIRRVSRFSLRTLCASVSLWWVFRFDTIAVGAVGIARKNG
jgi:hypothetical protein